MKDNNFELNKIKGDFAELICKHHFELMGFHLNKVGIEEISPTFAKLKNKLTKNIDKIHFFIFPHLKVLSIHYICSL